MLVTYEHKTQAYHAVLQNGPVTHTDYHTPRKAQHTLVTRARILLLTSKGEGKDRIAVGLDIGRSTVPRTRDHDRAGGLNRALDEAPRTGQPPKLDEKAAAHLVAMACSDPPEGRSTGRSSSCNNG
jgi:hypothetical protein